MLNRVAVVSLIALAIAATPAAAVNPPAVQWTRSLVGMGRAGGADVEQTRDGGFIVAGWTDSALGAKKAYLVKLNGSGSVQWQRVFGSSEDMRLISARQDSAGGYVIAGRTTLLGENRLPGHGDMAACRFQLRHGHGYRGLGTARRRHRSISAR